MKENFLIEFRFIGPADLLRQGKVRHLTFHTRDWIFLDNIYECYLGMPEKLFVHKAVRTFRKDFSKDCFDSKYIKILKAEFMTEEEKEKYKQEYRKNPPRSLGEAQWLV